MRQNRYYAAVLVGDEPKVIGQVFSFSAPSLRNQWVRDGVLPRVRLSARIAKKHEAIELAVSRYGDEYVWVEVI
jgi:hypothetical protein